jgi:3-dehydroquinate synthase
MKRRADATELRVVVELGTRSYEVVVVTSARSGFGRFATHALRATWAGQSCRKAVIVTDANVAALGLDTEYQRALEGAGLATGAVVFPPGEATKSLATAARLYDELASCKADRHTAIVALGGGVIGDVAGFAAATYARGLPLLMVPTTLLAQVDSSVGGKVGINHPAAKNSIGAFHQPVGVWIDTDTLSTLPERELRCGLAEVVKYGMSLDAELFAEVESRAEQILGRHHDVLRRIVARSCRLKAGVVARDERDEAGIRAVLNFGHTIGHAIESVAGYGGMYEHGEAVAVGMVAESRLAQGLGWIGADVVERLASLLARLGLPTAAPALDSARLLEAMSRDKKNQGGRLWLVLPRAIGRVELTDAAGEADVRAVLAPL